MKRSSIFTPSNSWKSKMEKSIMQELLPPLALSPLLGDFLIHSTPLYGVSNNTIMDAAWNTFNGNVITWLLSKKDSRYLIRQAFAGLNRYHRYQTTRLLSMLDYLISFIFTKSNVPINYFSIGNSKKRAARRFTLTCQRNEGIYNEKKELYSTILKAFSNEQYTEELGNESIFSQYMSAIKALRDNQAENYEIHGEITKLFEQDFGVPFSSIFESISTKPTRSYNGILTFNGTIKGNIPVSLTTFLPVHSRLQTIDLIPYNIRHFFLNYVFYSRSFANYSDAVKHRISFSLKDESMTRINLLSKLGINIEGSPQEIIEKASKHDFPFDIPVPIPKFTNNRFTVTSHIPSESPKIITKEWVSKLAEGTARALFDYNILIPNVSRSNIVAEKGRVSLSRFSGSFIAEPDFIKNASKVFVSKITNNSKLLEEVSHNMRIRQKHLESFINEPSFYTSLPLFKKFGQETLGTAELISGLINHTRNSGLDAQVFEPFAQRISNIVGESFISSNQIINYMNEFVGMKLE